MMYFFNIGVFRSLSYEIAFGTMILLFLNAAFGSVLVESFLDDLVLPMMTYYIFGVICFIYLALEII